MKKNKKSFGEIWSELTSEHREYLKSFIDKQRENAVKDYQSKQLALTGVVQAQPEVCEHNWINSITNKENNAPVYCYKCNKWVQTEQF